MTLELNADQALVLFDWLARLDERDSLPCEHEAERQVLWVVQGQLEKALTEPFQSNYKELTEQARSRVMNG